MLLQTRYRTVTKLQEINYKGKRDKKFIRKLTPFDGSFA